MKRRFKAFSCEATVVFASYLTVQVGAGRVQIEAV
jgi:hypothetical protein